MASVGQTGGQTDRRIPTRAGDGAGVARGRDAQGFRPQTEDRALAPTRRALTGTRTRTHPPRTWIECRGMPRAGIAVAPIGYLLALN